MFSDLSGSAVACRPEPGPDRFRAVSFNGVAATKFTVVSDTYMTAVVPSGATTGPVVVTTPGGALTSNVSFRIIN